MRTILIATIGTTPAVLTETVWALAVNGKKCIGESIVPDKVFVFTYEKCVEPFCKVIFANQGNGACGWDRLKENLQKHKVKIKDKLEFGKASIFLYRDGGIFVHDAFDEGAMDAIANTFVKEIKALRDNTSEPVRIIASVSGGRKTDGALLMSCMGLLGQKGDKVVHLIPSLGNQEHFSGLNFSNPQFLFPEDGVVYSFIKGDCTKRTFSKCRIRAEEVKLNLFEIPLLMTGKWYQNESHGKAITSYSDTIKQQQLKVEVLEDVKKDVEIDLEEGVVRVNGNPVKAQEKNKPLRPAAFLVLVCESIAGKQAEFGDYAHFLNECELKRRLIPWRWLAKLVGKDKRGQFRGDTCKQEQDLRRIHTEIKHVLSSYRFLGKNECSIPRNVISNFDMAQKGLQDALSILCPDLLKRLGIEQ